MFRDKSRDFRYKKLTVDDAQKIKAAFDKGAAMCFAFDKEIGVAAKLSFVSKILEGYPDVLLAKCDVFYGGTEPCAINDMTLLIKPEGDKESFNRMVDEIIVPSGIVSEAIFIGRTNDKGIKRAARRKLHGDDFAIVKMANLLVDGNHLLLTVRVLP